MKRLPIYGLLLAGYIIIGVGVSKLYSNLVVIEQVDIHTTSTSMPLLPSIVVSVFILIIALSIGGYLLSALWKYFVAHKTLIPLPILIVAVGFIQFSITIMNSFKTMIDNNSTLFISNLDKYIVAFQSLSMYTVIGILLIWKNIKN
jgi:hypothetical protein